MDVAQIFRELWLRRFWVLPGVVVSLLVALAIGWHLTLLPPKLRSKNLTIHTANTSILVDSPTSVVADLAAPLRQLGQLANIYARYMTNFPVREAIARRANLPVGSIVTSAPLASDQTSAARQPAAVQRSQSLLGEQKGYSLEFRTDSGLPTVTIFAEAPTVRDAIRLANAAALGFKDYIRRVEAARKVPLAQRVIIRQLGPPEGGSVGKSVRKAGVIAAFLGTMLAWFVLVLLASNVARNWKKLDTVEEA